MTSPNSRLSRLLCFIIDRVTDRILEFLRGTEGPTLRIQIGPVSERIIAMPDPNPPFILTDTQRVTLTLNPVDGAGNPAPIENVRWSSSDPTVLTIEPSANGMSCVVTTTGAIGQAQVSAIGDSKIGDGEEDITSLQQFNVVAGQAVGLGIGVGTPESRL